MIFQKEVLWETICINYQLGVMLIVKIPLSLVMLIWVRCSWQVSSISFLAHWGEIVGMEIEVQVILWRMVDIIPIDVLVDMVVPLVSQVVVMVVSLMILIDQAQIVPLPLNFGGHIDMTDIFNSMSNFNIVWLPWITHWLIYYNVNKECKMTLTMQGIHQSY